MLTFAKNNLLYYLEGEFFTVFTHRLIALIPLSNAIMCSTSCGSLYYLNHINIRRAQCDPNKQFTHQRNAIMCSRSCGSLYYLNHINIRRARQVPEKTIQTFPIGTQLSVVACGESYQLYYTNTRRARCAPNKHYEIPFVRSIPCSSFCYIQFN